MNKIVVVLIVSLLVFYSCSDNKEGNGKLLIKTVETSENGTSVTTLFKYNGNEILSAVGVKNHIAYTYENGLITKITSKDKENQLSVTLEYSYDKGKLVRMKSSENYVINYTHNSDGTVSYEKITVDPQNQGTELFYGTLYFENKNLIKDERTIDDVVLGLVSKYKFSFEYDSKMNPFYNILGYEKLLNQNEIISFNNSVMSVLEITITKDGKIISSANLYRGAFKYDEDHYPTEQLSEASIANPNYLKTQYFY
ncbi:hypothetical protein ACMDB5_06845 [Flavobacterium sp. W1B]|uniref:hypothetical protein n=1 Tax=Flavobacterium sp. W1B TaxID=3394146 RepID=UPI0039BCAFCF